MTTEPDEIWQVAVSDKDVATDVWERVTKFSKSGLCSEPIGFYLNRNDDEGAVLQLVYHSVDELAYSFSGSDQFYNTRNAAIVHRTLIVDESWEFFPTVDAVPADVWELELSVL